MNGMNGMNNVNGTLLERVEDRLTATVRGDGLLGAAASHLTSAPSAKRARPRLLLAFARLIDRSGDDQLVASAAAIELMHTASLLHDDVVDEADARRGRASANARFGNSAAVLAGDVVLARALRLLSFDGRAVDAALDVVSRMSTAAVREIELRGQRVAVDEALRIAQGKTGALFGLCGTLAALGTPHEDALRTAGEAFGVAFQVADDIDDVDVDARDGFVTVPLMTSRDDARALVDAHLDQARAALTPFADRDGHREVLAFAAALGRLRALQKRGAAWARPPRTRGLE
jgi:heptaprenyl diphosphate synthase